MSVRRHPDGKIEWTDGEKSLTFEFDDDVWIVKAVAACTPAPTVSVSMEISKEAFMHIAEDLGLEPIAPCPECGSCSG